MARAERGGAMTINKNAPTERNNEGAAKPIKPSQNSTTIQPKTNNQTELRALSALVAARGYGVSRKDLDKACGAANSPEIVRRLRVKGFAIHCEMRRTRNRFGESVQAGYYTLSGFGADDFHRLDQRA